jgi:hypothetical protein
VRSEAEVARVLHLARDGELSLSQISRVTGIPRTTIRNWLRGELPRRGSDRRRGTCPRCPDSSEFLAGMTAHAYAYLFGLYLGDGCLLKHPKGVYRLSIALDAAHPIIVEECRAAVGLTLPASRVAALRHPRCRMFNVTAYSRHWPHLFPQHGAGPKHLRSIVLERWQELIVDRYPGRLVRGLIHSDGCRVQNKVRHPKKTYVYPRYMFSNRSKDIQQIFCDACDRLDVQWRQDGPWNISVARRESVAVLDRHIGPKR